jgi:D-3-phosphoglycerate dehydrogenase
VTAGRILVLDSLVEDLDIEREVAGERGWSLEYWDGSDDQLGQADIALHVRTAVDKTIFEGLINCRVIGRFGTGLDTVDAELAQARGIELVNVRDYCIPELSAHTLGLILALTRATGADNGGSSLSGSWQSGVLADQISSLETVGIVGLGSVGRTVCAALVALGSTVLATSSKDAAAVGALGATKVELAELLARSDVVTLHIPLLPETARLIGAPELSLMRAGGMLVDTARLGLIDEQAVADALVAGRLGGLGLDARLGEDSPIARLRGTYRVIVTPHLGWYSQRSAAVLRRAGVSRSIDAFEQQQENGK